VYEIEFFEHPRTGKTPVIDWMEGELEQPKQSALLAALERVLAKQGLDVCGSEWGKQLGKGLAEFRIRHSADEIEHMFELERAANSEGQRGGKKEPEKIVLRVFFHAYGDKIILLLSGYDKGENPGERRQQKEIAKAREYLKLWQAAQKAAEKEARRGQKRPRPGGKKK
jgi:hypothetical protein